MRRRIVSTRPTFRPASSPNLRPHQPRTKHTSRHVGPPGTIRPHCSASACSSAWVRNRRSVGAGRGSETPSAGFLTRRPSRTARPRMSERVRCTLIVVAGARCAATLATKAWQSAWVTSASRTVPHRGVIHSRQIPSYRSLVDGFQLVAPSSHCRARSPTVSIARFGST
jgi:hypothetical protein